MQLYLAGHTCPQLIVVVTWWALIVDRHGALGACWSSNRQCIQCPRWGSPHLVCLYLINPNISEMPSLYSTYLLSSLSGSWELFGAKPTSILCSRTISSVVITERVRREQWLNLPWRDGWRKWWATEDPSQKFKNASYLTFCTTGSRPFASSGNGQTHCRYEWHSHS